ncbi:aminopeptidase N-like [Sitophilus oryzae]|uniref:Aminopeptidase n=1 Tax=Sitophilus oryzae TaxID=7048 RepID=A0A6J2XMH0_SITOR|nr:aminopeptidase N-like [Sitophilus oryzae]XP_030752546.1 aminopeptidase N-like [Sitophilus oryzae]XP_030752547.1 aminopeptidase N-like [Sitophilus oryzae]
MKTAAIAVLSFLTFVNGHDYRLPKNVMPENYRLEIITPLGEKDNFDFHGKVWIETSCVTPTKNITLHSKDLEIEEEKVALKDISSKVIKEIKELKVTYDKENDFLIILLDQPLTEDHRYEIYIPFKGKLNDGLAGFYRSSYVDSHTKEKKWLGVTQFEAISARRAFPCFDEPEMKATFDISVARKDGYRAISNMPLLTTEPMKEKTGWYWDRFDISVPMSTYLVAYVVSDFHYEEAEPLKDMNNVTFRIWARSDALNQVDFAKEVGPKALRYFEKFFNIDYPLPKQDMVAIPDFSAGAMENWGLITYREAYLLYDPQVSSKVSQHRVASVIAHELAHQWFGNLVTMKWWTDLWLNEGFATYMASLAVDHLFPKWNSLDAEGATNILSVFSFDALRSSHPVSVPIGNPKQIDEIFDTISYKKGSSLIRMMSLFLGEETLRSGVSKYLRDHRYHNAEQDDLWQALTESAHEKGTLPKELTVKTIMDTWTVQTGYPVITVHRDYENETAEITQERFLKDTIKVKDDTKPCWWVPLSYSSQSHPEFNITTPKYWLSCPNDQNQLIQHIAGPEEWVIFNNKMAGIYKINYDDKNWHLLTEALKSEESDKIPVLNRVQLIADSADLAFVGKQNYEIFFDLITYLANETEYLPWSTALGKTGVIKTYLQKSPSYGTFKNYMKHLLTPAYEKTNGLSSIEKDESDQLDNVKFHSLLAGRSCKFGVESCIHEAVQLFKQWQDAPDGHNPIPKDLRSVVYCTALEHGGEKEWNFLWEKYQHSNVATEKSTLLSVLGCTNELWILSRYLEWSLDDSKVRRQDAGSVFSTVASNEVGYFIAKNFLFENVEKIFKHLAPNNRRISGYLSSVANKMTQEKEEHELDYFIHAHKEKFSEVKQGVDQALETVKINIQWQKKHAKEIEEILKKFSKE